MKKIKWAVLNFPEIVLVTLLGALTVLITISVFFRYALNSPLVWSDEGCRFLFIWLSFLGAALCVKHRMHFRMIAAVERFSPRIQRLLETLVILLTVGFGIFLIKFGQQTLKFAAFQRFVMMDVSAVWSFLSLPICGALITLYSVIQFIEHIYRKKRDK